MKIFSFVSTVLFSISLFAQTGKDVSCPEWKGDQVKNQWRLNNSALLCRSQCQTAADCSITKDSCGRVLIYNKVYSEELKTILKQGDTVACENKFEGHGDIKLECKNQKCSPVFEDCQAGKKRLKSFIAEKMTATCDKDSDCTFFLAASESCAQRIPVNRTVEISRIQLNLDYLRESVLTSCGQRQIKECDPMEKPFCAAKECIMLKEKPKFKNFVNLEGKDYLPNFKSNTTPLKLPPGSHSKCLNDADCVDAIGVCSQYIVSLNKVYLTTFNDEVSKVSKSIACPVIPSKLNSPKSKCFKNFCSFVN